MWLENVLVSVKSKSNTQWFLPRPLANEIRDKMWADKIDQWDVEIGSEEVATWTRPRHNNNTGDIYKYLFQN